MHVLRLTSTWVDEWLVLGGAEATCQQPVRMGEYYPTRCMQLKVLKCADSARIYGWMGGCTDVGTLRSRMYGRTCGVCTAVLTVMYGCICGVRMAVLGDAELELDGGFLPLNSYRQL